MNAEQIQQILKQHQTKLDTLGVKSLTLFGSIARNESTENSDIDFMVAFKEIVTFDKYMDLKLLLEDLLEMRVDLVTVDGVREQIRPIIENEGIHVA
ncbi:MAG: DNA polymerase subunit beta [Chloroflexi bacterium]|nr:DNA polymerase subunit beta [Chloroflexota bacterium]